jgi:hypothetical protein
MKMYNLNHVHIPLAKCSVQMKYTHYTLVLVGSKKKNVETDMQIVNTNYYKSCEDFFLDRR